MPTAIEFFINIENQRSINIPINITACDYRCRTCKYSKLNATKDHKYRKRSLRGAVDKPLAL